MGVNEWVSRNHHGADMIKCNIPNWRVEDEEVLLSEA